MPGWTGGVLGAVGEAGLPQGWVWVGPGRVSAHEAVESSGLALRV